MIGVLFVDDDSHLLTGLRRLTRSQAHWSTRAVTDGATALEVVGTNDIDVVVTDMRMPGMDGLELMERLHGSHPHVVRIVLTGHVDERRRERAGSLAHAWLDKPCALETLVTIIDASVAVPRRGRGPRVAARA